MEHPLYQARLQVKADMLDLTVTISRHFRNILPSQSLSIVLKKVNITQQIRYAPMKKKQKARFCHVVLHLATGTD